MKYIWQSEYNTGIAVIDSQHQELFRIINRLENSMETAIIKKEFDEILQDIYDYTRYHFITEECFFEDMIFESKAHHIKLHNDFIQRLDQFMKTHDYSEQKSQSDLYEFLSSWIIQHILIDDQKYVGKLKDQI